jgi:hypothetical protein
MGARKLVTLIVIVVAVLLTATYLLWDGNRDVRRRVAAIAEAASVRRNDTPLERAARAAALGKFVTGDVIIRTDASTFVGGRPGVVRFVLDGAAALGQITLSVDDVQIERIDPSTATVFLTLTIFGENPQLPDPAPRQVHATFSRIGGEWLLSRGEVLRTLEVPVPSSPLRAR